MIVLISIDGLGPFILELLALLMLFDLLILTARVKEYGECVPHGSKQEKHIRFFILRLFSIHVIVDKTGVEQLTTVTFTKYRRENGNDEMVADDGAVTND